MEYHIVSYPVEEIETECKRCEEIIFIWEFERYVGLCERCYKRWKLLEAIVERQRR